jgi:hypothetical protein
MKVVGTHAKPNVTREAAPFQPQCSFEGTARLETRVHRRWIVQQDGVKIVEVEESELFLDVALDRVGAGVRQPPAGLARPIRIECIAAIAVQAHPGADNHSGSFHSPQSGAELAERIAVASRAIEMVNPELKRAPHQPCCGLVADRPKKVAKSLRAKWDDWYVQTGTSPTPTGYLLGIFRHDSSIPSRELAVCPPRPLV